MSVLSLLTGGLVEGVGNAVSGVVKTIAGSKAERDSQAHAEQISVMDQFAAEFLPRENRTWWDSLVDGLNRLPRPVMTFGIIYLFWYAIDDPVGFAASMAALGAMPAEGWGVMAVIVAFWFGGKFLGKDLGGKFSVPSPEQLRALLELRRDLKAEAKEKAAPESAASIVVRELPPI